MATDIIMDDEGGNYLTLSAFFVRARAADFMLDHPQRRRPGAGGYRRALVHDPEDGLTINYANDYPGGIKLNSAKLNLRAMKGAGGLPKTGNVGDLIFVYYSSNDPRGVGMDKYRLYICVGHGEFLSGVRWQEIPLGETVLGTT